VFELANTFQRVALNPTKMGNHRPWEMKQGIELMALAIAISPRAAQTSL